jgi:carbonic anhydrase
MGAIDELLARHEAGHATPGTTGAEPLESPRPRLRVTVLTCMDARINPAEVLGLRAGDAHVLRNAGGLATEDALRSLLLSQHALGTQEIMIIQHTNCGLYGMRDADVAGRVEATTGAAVPFELGGFDDVDASVRASLERVRAAPWLARRDQIRGFVYDVERRKLREVY